LEFLVIVIFKLNFTLADSSSHQHQHRHTLNILQAATDTAIVTTEGE